ncbi:MAG: PAS domain S-box protein [Planctomycetaceae bacterium]|nr:PAS domain S-box protein [Planctomycetaceae bacterium]
MTMTPRPDLENRVLLLAPTGKDGTLTCSILSDAGIDCCVCADLRSLIWELQAGAGALLIAEEALLDDGAKLMVTAISHQPPWSDLPLIILTLSGASSLIVGRMLDSPCNVTLLERPVRMSALVSTARTALRARQRQYQTRARLTEHEATQKALRESESDLRDFFENSPLGLHFVGPDGIILRVNQSELDMLGYKHHEYVGRHIAEFHAEPQLVHDLLRRVFRGETVHNAEARLLCKDGSIRHVLISSNCLWKDGRFTHTRCFTRDITDRIKLDEKDALLASIVESSADAIISKDLNGVILSWNRGAEHLFGYTASEAIGQSITMMIPPERLDEEPTILARLRLGERIEHFETIRVTKNGRRIDISLTVSPIRDRSGRIIAASKVARDITDHKRMVQTLQDTDRRKDEFLATLAHELRNPLAPIRNSLHVLCLKCDDPAMMRICEMMERQVNQLVRLVDDLLDVSRITRGKVELRKEPVELATVIRNAVEISQPMIDDAGHQLAITIPTEPVIVEGDSVRLAQVFANLLNNSAKYTDPGGQILLTANPQNGEVLISVRDNGLGIDSEILPHVFETFTQGNLSTARGPGGLGLGLALVKSLVELHGGHVEARSAGAKQGSEFVVRLPMSSGTPSPKAATPSHSRPVLPKRRVLVVDDNQESAVSMGMLLEILGLETHVVHSGREALLAIETFPPEIVLLDIGMPEMDGYEVARRIRQHAEWRDIQLIALTGWGQEEDRRRSKSMGFNHHLTKPADLGILESVLMSLDGTTCVESAAGR